VVYTPTLRHKTATWFRGSDCKYRESADKLKKSKILITCQKNAFGKLSLKMLLKPSGIPLFSGNSEIQARADKNKNSQTSAAKICIMK